MDECIVDGWISWPLATGRRWVWVIVPLDWGIALGLGSLLGTDWVSMGREIGPLGLGLDELDSALGAGYTGGILGGILLEWNGCIWL